jgi:hypothetical protein
MATLWHGTAGPAAHRIEADGLNAGAYVTAAHQIARRVAAARAREGGGRGTVFSVEATNDDLQWLAPGEARILRRLPAHVLNDDVAPEREGQPREPNDRHKLSMGLRDPQLEQRMLQAFPKSAP